MFFFLLDITLCKDSNSWCVLFTPLEDAFPQDKTFNRKYSLYCRKLKAGEKWNTLRHGFNCNKKMFTVPGRSLSFEATYEFQFRATDNDLVSSDPFTYSPIANYGKYMLKHSSISFIEIQHT